MIKAVITGDGHLAEEWKVQEAAAVATLNIISPLVLKIFKLMHVLY